MPCISMRGFIGEDAVRVNRDGVDVGRAYLELTGYANALRIGKE
jgi:hypothetical protein